MVKKEDLKEVLEVYENGWRFSMCKGIGGMDLPDEVSELIYTLLGNLYEKVDAEE